MRLECGVIAFAYVNVIVVQGFCYLGKADWLQKDIWKGHRYSLLLMAYLHGKADGTVTSKRDTGCLYLRDTRGAQSVSLALSVTVLRVISMTTTETSGQFPCAVTG